MEANSLSMLVPQTSRAGIMDEEDQVDDHLGSPSSSSSSSSCCDSAGSSTSSELQADDATSKLNQSWQGGSYEMAPSLVPELPFKRGLSRHIQGKSQSFTSLANVRYLKDLVKPTRPYFRKKLKSSRSYSAGMDSQRPRALPHPQRLLSKWPAGFRSAALPSLQVVKRPAGFLGGGGGRPPRGCRSSTAHTLLFA